MLRYLFYYQILIVVFYRVTQVCSFKINVPRVLLPPNTGVSTNFSLEVSEFQPADCFEWFTSDPHVVVLYTTNECSRKAILSAVSNSTERQEAFVSISLKGTAKTLFVDVIVDAIHSFGFMHQTSEITLGSPPEVISLFVVNSAGHTFSSHNGVEFEWTISNLYAEPNLGEKDIVRFDKNHTSYEIPNGWNRLHKKDSYVVIKAENVGTAMIKAELKSKIYMNVDAAEMKFVVSASEQLEPADSVYILPSSKVNFCLVSKYGQLSESSLSYKIKVLNSSVVAVGTNLSVTGLDFGETEIVLEATNRPSFHATVHVVEPKDIKLNILPDEKWSLREASSYEVFVDLYDAFNHKIYPSKNLKYTVLFPGRLFHINSSSPNGQYHSIRTLVPGSNIIKAAFNGIVNEAGQIKTKHNLSTSQKIVIYQSVQLLPSVVVLPFYNNASALYSIPFKATGGTGFYTWSTSDSFARITHETKPNNVIVHFHSMGDFSITARDKNSSTFYASAKVSIQQISEIEVYPTVVEAEVGNDIIIPVALLGFEDKEKKIYRKFDDCSRIHISVDIVEKHIVTYKEAILGSDVPAFGRGCLSLQFFCKLPGHSRVNLKYQLGSNSSLKTTVVIACYKKLRSIHPVRVAVLAVGSSKEVVFEGGPRPWPLLPKGHYVKLIEEKAKYLDIQVVKDPHRYNKDLHVFQVLCKQLGETNVQIYIGNEASATNQNPAKLSSSVKIVCSEPQTLHLTYNVKQEKKTSSNRPIVKVPFYGKKLFEIDFWMKDSIGRKFANISSFNMVWEVSDYTIAKPQEHRDFSTHVDGAAGYRKVSRNFKEFEMTGKTGLLSIKAKLTGYRRDVLEKGNIKDYKELEVISESIDLEFISLRDIYDDTYSTDSQQNDNGNCNGDTCKS